MAGWCPRSLRALRGGDGRDSGPRGRGAGRPRGSLEPCLAPGGAAPREHRPDRAGLRSAEARAASCGAPADAPGRRHGRRRGGARREAPAPPPEAPAPPPEPARPTSEPAGLRSAPAAARARAPSPSPRGLRSPPFRPSPLRRVTARRRLGPPRAGPPRRARAPHPAFEAEAEAPAGEKEARSPMSLVVWVMMGIAVWHFTVFVPDRFWGGIVGAFLVAFVSPRCSASS